MSDNVYIIGVGMIKFGKNFEKSMKAMTGESLQLALDDCGLTKDDIQAAWFSNSGWGMSEFQHSIRGQVALAANGLDKVSIINVENACASGSTALHSAWMSIKAGVYDCALAIGTEKMYFKSSGKGEGKKNLDGFISGTDVEETRQLIKQIQEEAKQKRKQEEKEAKEKGIELPPEKSHSVFMDFYARGARDHMAKYGTTQRQLAVIAAKAHNNSTLNPLAQYTFPQTVEQVMADREVAFPLTRAMCAPVGDGSAAAIVCSESFLKKHPSARAVLIRASVMQSGNKLGVNDASIRAAKLGFEMAGVGPEDIHVMEVHDATAFGELHQVEQLGFCPVGEGGPFAESGATSLGGKIPVNPSGGLISRGHPIGASGLAQTYELVTHLRGEAGKRQVENAKIAMAENGGGTIGGGEAAMAIHIYEKI
ncbi:MAG: thiolase family protein [Deltaproteobacteria bacterium]|nr:thiolase family protein [Deltaproteobacteria bacterium]MBW2052529.1 thiolase family protein [Deltaproteobacteria bacterium]